MSQERVSRGSDILGAPVENFSRGLLSVDLHPDFGPKIEGKVRNNWVLSTGHRIMATTDRQSAFDRIVCTVPGKGKALNLTSAFWFASTKDIIPNHMIAIPHPNVLIATQAEATLPVEIIVREYMARSSTKTSVYYNYVELGRKEIYGINFPEGLRANEKFEKPIITPTTKADAGNHDEELTAEEARDIVDSKFGKGTYSRVEDVAFKLFQRGAAVHRANGLILADTKYEFGIDKDGNLILIDELHTSDSSRLWLKGSYKEKFETGENPDTFDKDILRRRLVELGFRGDGKAPFVDPQTIDRMAEAYSSPYGMITGTNLPMTPNNPSELAWDIRKAVNRYYGRLS